MKGESKLGIGITLSIVTVMLILIFLAYSSNLEFVNKFSSVESTLLQYPDVYDYVFKNSQDSMNRLDKVFVHDMVTYTGATEQQSRVVQSLIDKFGDKELASIIYKLTEQKFTISERCIHC